MVVIIIVTAAHGTTPPANVPNAQATLARRS
jgi:hypothetical protein